MSEIKNIIFDLGGVIINLDYSRTINEFNRLTNKPFETIFTQLQQSPLFDQFDKGTISESDFFEELKNSLYDQTTREEVLHAWNAMLLDFPKERLELLLKLKSGYRVFLLSNTNETHVRELESHLFQQHSYQNLETFFEKVYYSCRIGMRKPDREIFEFVLKENNLNKNETIFIDDSPQHIQGAMNTGIQSYYLTKGRDVVDLITELKLLPKESEH
ncbi:MAG: family hydrolase [Bacteroidetes bacterium]|jgi:putative hydrolase of the HAD superfamily|nr:family hydrolase [Bacteroidota bacterium]MDF2453790.1 family hydrolase [Bacteroidota bacterium]